MAELLSKPLSKASSEHINEFSKKGLRTLVIARRELTSKE